MRIHLYTMSWNEERMLPFFFNHYGSIVERFVVYDDGSTDRTLEILRALPCVEVREFQRSVVDSFVLSAQSLQNSCWKESRGSCDWVIMTALDEHLHHKSLVDYLEEQKKSGVTAIPALGYQMVDDNFPEDSVRLADALTRGAPFKMMNKLSIFNPNAIIETNFAIGRHSAAPIGNVKWPERDEVLNLHYKYIGLGFIKERHALLRTGLGDLDKSNHWGHRYSFSEEELRQDFEQFRQASVDLSAPGYVPHRDHCEERWWRLR